MNKQSGATKTNTKADPASGASDDGKSIEIPRTLTVKDLGDLVGMSPIEVIKELIKNGVMASINQVIDYDTAAIIAHDLGFEPEPAAGEALEIATAGRGGTGGPQRGRSRCPQATACRW